MLNKQHLWWIFFTGSIIACCSAVSGGSDGQAKGLYNYGGLAAANSGGSGTGTSSSRMSAQRYYMPSGLGNPSDSTSRYGSTTPSQQRSVVTPKTSRISAWGIISIVMFVIMIGAGAYWGFICYPVLCKKERNYNMMMNMSTATTATPTRSTEFEKLENYCAKSTTSSRSNDTGISNI
ncbi:uncharacterized protein LOC129773253 [Toxorhynchites rutilus septentrionalis]|uniref:uncharacterized protein LOC129773253 n=1 Tax=Toxorhynchites rutilus septentrionalis TaxID=329112 RepID=UPI00247B014B|nr:uncharacterized protein LOC129773253 [Toxorhynchites rutilus septentrionalis]XP_055632828.1 uncharacterized protein LOC129773253 [Toxorhynchites rutilus septentrionalis]